MNVYDSVILGGGPAGMTAALYLLRSGARIAFAEKLSPGGQVLNTEEIENYPGFPKGLKGYELADLFAAHLEGYAFDRFSAAAVSMQTDADGHIVRLDSKEELKAKTVIIATGARYKSLGLEREDYMTGRGVSYCALCDGNFFRGQEVAVVGGGDSALEESLYLAKIVKKVHLIHRRDAFRGAKIYQDKVIAEPKISIIYNSVVTELLGDVNLTGVMLHDKVKAEQSRLDVDGLFIFVGFEPVSGFLPSCLKTDSQGFILTDTEMQTNIPGIFAAGDIRSKLCRQVTTAVGDGATAANAAHHYLEQHS